ncbi:MAG: nucleotidyltransferase domain-containing protein [Candidatus Caldarchaeum sp.]|nr:nucleotidyltransferase domain-containing protein [Candidatus Caldarchaeum sp.]
MRSKLPDYELRFTVFLNNVISKIDGKVTLILFGSRSKGDFAPWSDFDVLLITPPGTKFERTSLILEANTAYAPLELFIVDVDAVEQEMETSTIILDAVAEGRVLHDGLGLYSRLKDKLERLQKTGWKKNSGGWTIPKLRDGFVENRR